MKNKLLFYFFYSLSIFSCFSQSHIISEYEKYDYTKQGITYSKQLMIEDNNSLILKLDNNRYIVYKNELEIAKINIGYLSGQIVKNEKIKEDKLVLYKRVLDSLSKINPALLNEIENTGKNPISSIQVQDGMNYSLELFKSNYRVNYSTYAPEVYIENKFPFYQERIKFLKVIKIVNDFFYDDEYEKMKNIDTLYLTIVSKDLLIKEKLNIKTAIRDFTESYTFTSLNDHMMFVNTKCDKNSQKKGDYIKVNRKLFLQQNKDACINLLFLDKYGLDLVLNKKKVVYIIDLEDSKKSRILLRKANFR